MAEEKLLPLEERIQRLRVNVGKKCNKKSGKNAYAGFDYFELKDFLPTVNEECLANGICPQFNITTVDNAIWSAEKEDYVVDRKDIARLTIKDIYSDRNVKFEIPFVAATLGGKQNEIQCLGASITYLKRYLYMNFLELSDGDAVDATIGKTEEKKPTYNQLTDFLLGYTEEERALLRERYGVAKDDDIPRDAVKKYIADRKEIIKAKKADGALDFTTDHEIKPY